MALADQANSQIQNLYAASSASETTAQNEQQLSQATGNSSSPGKEGGVSGMDVVAGVGGSGLAGTVQTVQDGSLGTWVDKSGKVRPNSFNGNQYTGGKNAFAGNMAKTAGRLGNAASAVSTFVSGYQTIEATMNGDTDAAVQSGVDTLAGAAGFAGPVGRAFSGGYAAGSIIDDATGISDVLGDDMYNDMYNPDPYDAFEGLMIMPFSWR